MKGRPKPDKLEKNRESAQNYRKRKANDLYKICEIIESHRSELEKISEDFSPEFFDMVARQKPNKKPEDDKSFQKKRLRRRNHPAESEPPKMLTRSGEKKQESTAAVKVEQPNRKKRKTNHAAQQPEVQSSGHETIPEQKQTISNPLQQPADASAEDHKPMEVIPQTNQVQMPAQQSNAHLAHTGMRMPAQVIQQAQSLPLPPGMQQHQSLIPMSQAQIQLLLMQYQATQPSSNSASSSNSNSGPLLPDFQPTQPLQLPVPRGYAPLSLLPPPPLPGLGGLGGGLASPTPTPTSAEDEFVRSLLRSNPGPAQQ